MNITPLLLIRIITALLSDSGGGGTAELPSASPPVRKYSAYEPPQPVLVSKRLSTGQLILRRGLIILIFTGLFVASIIIRITVPVPGSESYSLEANSTIPPDSVSDHTSMHYTLDMMTETASELLY